LTRRVSSNCSGSCEFLLISAPIRGSITTYARRKRFSRQCHILQTFFQQIALKTGAKLFCSTREIPLLAGTRPCFTRKLDEEAYGVLTPSHTPFWQVHSVRRLRAQEPILFSRHANQVREMWVNECAAWWGATIRCYCEGEEDAYGVLLRNRNSGIPPDFVHSFMLLSSRRS
jgi:hypothetical protein